MDLPSRPRPTKPLGTSNDCFPGNGTSPLRCVSMLDLLDQDIRPTFIIDTAPSNLQPENSCLLEYWNAAMAGADSGDLLCLLSGNASVPSCKEKGYAPFSEFRVWSLAQNTEIGSFLFYGFTWTKVTVAQKWNVISGIAHVSSVSSDKLKTPSLSWKTSRSKVPSYDWTDEVNTNARITCKIYTDFVHQRL